MKIKVRIKPNARITDVVKLPDDSYLVSVVSPPVEGRANRELIAVLADYFQKPKGHVEIVVGKRGRHKIVEIS